MRRAHAAVAFALSGALAMGIGAPGAQADPPPTLSYQGLLLDAAGERQNGLLEILFSIYDVDAGGVPLWVDVQSVDVADGVFHVLLGSTTNPLPVGLFAGPRFLGVTVTGDSELVPRTRLVSSPYALACQDASSLQGLPASALDQSAHVADTSNPHAVGWKQLSGIPAGFSDGVDDDSGGDVTRVTAGFGLTGGGSAGDLVLSANTALMQRRVNGQCVAGEFMQAVAQSGAVTCAADQDTDTNADTLCTSTLLLNGSGSCVLPNDHEHFGQTWTGALAGPGLSVENTAVVLGSSAVEGTQPNVVASGYLGVEGANDFAGIPALDIGGRELGVLGIANDTGAADNFGLYGYSNGVGLHAEGGILAGEFVGDVEVEGELVADRLRYRTPRTHYYSVGDGDFHTGSGQPYRTSGGPGGSYIFDTGAGWLVAGLHLPHGAVIRRFKVITDDGAAGDLLVTLSRRLHTGSGFASLASVSSSGTPGIQTLTDTTISNATIDNDLFAYHVRASSASWPGTAALTIKGAVVEYTLDEAL